MPILQSITSGLLSRHAAKRVARVIPNPILRYVLITATTAVVPVLVNRAIKQWHARSARRHTRRGARGGMARAHSVAA